MLVCKLTRGSGGMFPRKILKLRSSEITETCIEHENLAASFSDII